MSEKSPGTPRLSPSCKLSFFTVIYRMKVSQSTLDTVDRQHATEWTTRLTSPAHSVLQIITASKEIRVD